MLRCVPSSTTTGNDASGSSARITIHPPLTRSFAYCGGFAHGATGQRFSARERSRNGSHERPARRLPPHSEAADCVGRELRRWWRRTEHDPQRAADFTGSRSLSRYGCSLGRYMERRSCGTAQCRLRDRGRSRTASVRRSDRAASRRATGSISCNATRRSSRSDISPGRQREKIRDSHPMPFFGKPDGRRAIRRPRSPRLCSTGRLLTPQSCPVSGTRRSKMPSKSSRCCHTRMSASAYFAAESCFAATAPPFAKRSHAVNSAFTPARSAEPFRRSFDHQTVATLANWLARYW